MTKIFFLVFKNKLKKKNLHKIFLKIINQQKKKKMLIPPKKTRQKNQKKNLLLLKKKLKLNLNLTQVNSNQNLIQRIIHRVKNFLTKKQNNKKQLQNKKSKQQEKDIMFLLNCTKILKLYALCQEQI